MTEQESARENVANALQAFEQPAMELADGIAFTFEEATAIRVRLRKALAQIDVASGRRGVGALLADFESGVVLRAVGDHVERVYPEAASTPSKIVFIAPDDAVTVYPEAASAADESDA